MSDFDHGLDLSHLTVWPPQPTTLVELDDSSCYIPTRNLLSLP
jgi:hypothetical protein